MAIVQITSSSLAALAEISHARCRSVDHDWQMLLGALCATVSSALSGDKGCRPFPRTPFSASGILPSLRFGQFLLTKVNISCTIELPASLRSDGVRDHPGMPFGIIPDLAIGFVGIPTPGSNRISRKGTSQTEGLPPGHRWILETRPAAGTTRGRMTGGTGAQDAGKIARALLRLQFERFFDWNSATGFENSLLPDLSQVDGTAIAQDISVEHCVAFSPPGSRSDLWIRVRAATDGYGRREMPGSRHRVQRSDLSRRNFPPSPIFRLVDHRSRNHLGLQKGHT
jgi:hypothetical protein